ncbi:hypothetical protein [Dietzia timorensis]|uniref:Secreted protein n=1 Tax=Dietzia timorensis TaxID=499555 RepID=A0A173LP74_9ACTN|nr:hypothetical protein [Dietzia timorensis]ANI93311.1 Hypothetical protein BJL86_2551 [Dietzia timorensis]
MSENRLNVRRAGLAIAAAAALTAGIAPFAAAQEAEAPANGSLNTESVTGEEGSLGGGSLDGISADPAEKSCELPSLGGSVDALLPYAGLSIPGFVKNILIKGLDTIDNPLETAGINISELGVGSLEGPICSVLLGGEMTEVPETTEESTTETTTPAEDDDAEGDDEGAEGDDTEGDDAEATTSEVPTAGGSLSLGS